MKTVLFCASTIAGMVACGGAIAGERYAATIDVNIRSGPGANYPIVEILHSGETIAATKCDTGWCSVTAPGGGEGWIASRFLAPRGSAAFDAGPTPDHAAPNSVSAAPSTASVDTTTTSAVPTVGSPAALALSDAARKYVTTHRPVSVDLGGEPQVGSTIPTDIRLRDIPGSRYQYVYVDGRPIFVDGETRQIVQVER
jgi:Protein of unknown function (DUF1236)/Bacterial SH3 domain